MDFGRLDDISHVDFTLPPDPPETEAYLASLPPRVGAPVVHVGAPVWAHPKWVGKVYPRGTKPKDFLIYYVQQFDSIEVNSTRYNIPSPATTAEWYRLAPAGFKFCPKLPQTISEAHLYNTTETTKAYLESVGLLKEKLGPSLLQFGPRFGPKRLAELYDYLQHFPKHIPLTVEMRHTDWFAEPHSELFEVLQNEGITAAITDVSGRRDVLHMRLTTPTAFIRFTGNNLHPTDFTRMDAWALRIKKWLDAGLEAVYFMVHLPDKELCPEMVNYMVERLNLHCKLNLKSLQPPESLAPLSLF